MDAIIKSALSQKPGSSVQRPHVIKPYGDFKPAAKHQNTPKAEEEILPRNLRFGLDKMLKLHPSHIEVEVSFGVFIDRKFVPGVSVAQFNNMTAYLMSLASKGILSTPKLRTTVEEMQNGGNWPIKRITDELGNITWQVKEKRREDALDNQNWGYRINKALEEMSDSGPSNFTPNFKRLKQRLSFIVLPKEHELYGLQFDLTKVTEYKDNTSILKYEIEIERKAVVSSDAFEKAISLTLHIIQKASDNSQLMTLFEKDDAIKAHNDLFEPTKPIPQYMLFSNYWNKPVNIKINDLLNPLNNYYVTLKVNGVRTQVFIDETGIYSCLPPYDIWKIGRGNKKLSGTLIDAEVYINPKTKQTIYYLFDILFLKGEDLRQRYFADRLKVLKSVAPDILLQRGEEINVKNFYNDKNIYKSVEMAFEEAAEMEENGITLDGLIFQSHVFYKNNFTKKWKDEEDLTIDFLLKHDVKDKFLLYTTDAGNPVLFTGSKNNPVEPLSITLKNGLLNVPNSIGIVLNPPADGAVVECAWDYEKKKFVPVRYRDDKLFPNAINTASDVWEDIMNPISQQTIQGETLTVMRKFHNMIKKHFLTQEFKKGDVIMDWGSGRGGDIQKWTSIGLDTVYVVEPSVENFKEFENRLETMDTKKTKIVPIKHKKRLVGAQETDHISEVIDKKLDGVVSFFSLTFFGKDETMFNNMISTLDKFLPVGGKFLGIVMDGAKTQELLETDDEAKEGEMLLFDSPAFSIQQSTEFLPNKISEGKNEIYIQIKDPKSMVDQQEWLFYFDVLEKALEKIGFSLEYDGYLDENAPLIEVGGKKSQIYNLLPEGAKTFSGLNRYFLFVRKTLSKQSESPKTVEQISDFGFDFTKALWGKKLSPQIERDYQLVTPMAPSKGNKGFIHAVLYAVDNKYRNMSASERVDKVDKVLRMMATKLTFEFYTQMMGDLGEESYEELKLSLFNGDNVSYEIYSDILSHLLKINIFTPIKDGKNILNPADPELFECHDYTIVIYKEDGGKMPIYSVITDFTNLDSVYTVYKTSNPLIRRLLEKASQQK